MSCEETFFFSIRHMLTYNYVIALIQLKIGQLMLIAFACYYLI
jgi:hypothetical protein